MDLFLFWFSCIHSFGYRAVACNTHYGGAVVQKITKHEKENNNRTKITRLNGDQLKKGGREREKR